MQNILISIEDATREAVAPYGHLLAAREGQPIFAAWPGTTVYGATPIVVETGGEILIVRSDAKAFPHIMGIIERHPLHTQTYLPFNGKPFVMVLGLETADGAPVLEKLRAFRFADASGIALHHDVWHDFPYALEDDTAFAVILSNVAHINDLAEPVHPMEAEGPDLERRSIRARANVTVDFPCA